MAKRIGAPFLVEPESSFRLAERSTKPPVVVPSKRALEAELDASVDRISDLQQKLYAENRQALLLIFQAMDAAGKDGTIRAVTSGVDPAGFQVYSFKRPSDEELDHDFLWRTACRLPERGRIGIFNRSYYEEVLVVRVNPGVLSGQRVPGTNDLERLWTERMESIRDHERHLVRQGTRIIKFMLHVSEDEQERRLLKRLDDERRNWKFELGDLDARDQRAAYLTAYDDALRSTSTDYAPWHVIPADDKAYMRAAVAGIIADTLADMDPQYPEVDPAVSARIDELRARLRQG
jgi:PPK2 family polyphosphate:nucleotide phosphotransferase